MKTLISNYQATLILIVIIVSTAIVFLPSIIIQIAHQDSWLSIILLFMIAPGFIFVYYALCQKMGRTNLIQFTRKTFGKYLYIPFILFTIIAFIVLSGTIVRETAEVMITAYMPLTPLWFFNFTIIFTAAILIYYGLEVIGRCLEIFFYLFLSSFLLIIILLIPDMSLNLLQPVLGEGIMPVLKGIYPGLLFFSELFIILILAPHLTQKGKVLKPLLSANFFAGGILLIVILSILTLFGSNYAQNLTIPLVTVNSYVEKFKIVERLDPLFIFYWIGGGIFKVSIFMYIIVYSAQKLFKLSTYHIFIPIIIPPVYYFSFYYFQNLAQLTDFLTSSIHWFLGILILYPALLLIISWIRGVDCSET